MKLHIGCGRVILPGWTNLDIEAREGVDIVDDAQTLEKIEDGSCEIIYACHILEHVSRHKVRDVLALWHRKLKSGGLLRLSVPDFGKVIERYTEKNDLEEIMGLVIGGQRNEFDYHGVIFDQHFLTDLLTHAGFHQVNKWNWRTAEHNSFDDYSQAYLPHLEKEEGMLMSLNLEATA